MKDFNTQRVIVPVILCGGSGTRLWPLSHQNKPKQFLKLINEHSFFQETVLRTLEVTRCKRSDIVVVTLVNFFEETIAHLEKLGPGLTDHVLVEPEGRNTAAAFALAAHYVRECFGEDALMWVLPSDHYIGDHDQLRGALEEARQAAAQGYMVTFGITPTSPETGYGYIAPGKALAGGAGFEVMEFVEKPQRETAEKYVRSGDYLWSSGMHLFSPGTVLDAFFKHDPDTAEKVTSGYCLGGSRKSPLPGIYKTIKKQPFEKSVLEKSDNRAVVRCDLNWADIGTWNSLWRILKKKIRQGSFDPGEIVSALQKQRSPKVVSVK